MSEPSVLLVEDDKKIASFLVKGLRQSGYAVDHCRDGDEALALGRTVAYDAAVFDIDAQRAGGPVEARPGIRPEAAGHL